MSELDELAEFILCKIGCHKFEKKKETKGLIDCGEYVLVQEITWIGCSRKGCTVTKDIKKEWIEIANEKFKNQQYKTREKQQQDTTERRYAFEETKSIK